MNSGKLDNELGVLLQREEAKYSENWYEVKKYYGIM
jgi:hypothetical protein